jgi:regulator of protease activity HflC (stomatin/prohibitin superfamily)
MKLEPVSSFLGNLPGAGGNPWVGLVYVATLITGAGLVRFAFFSVRKNERGVWLRLGNVVQCWFGDEPKLLRPGRPGVRFPFIWRLVKISVNVRTNRTEDIETTRRDADYDRRQKWVIKCDINWRVQSSGFRVMRAALRPEDLQETVMAIITNAIRSSVYAEEVGEMETDGQVLAAIKLRAKSKLAGLGVSIGAVNIIKYAPVDAQILANAIEQSPSGSAGSNGQVTAIAGSAVAEGMLRPA